ncbi:LysR family transcriptional regulator [Furfurilactobacillus curtus]|uniref:LysR family transcriptional regulator n=1 Tax=Furfurilactobacillus curtus TaxID=1746200 RepID=A0ABQ5JPJ9_9LACO
MTERLTEFLTAINQFDTLTAAAQSLYVSQSYISRRLNNAEKEYGVRLVERQRIPVHLTYAGERLLSYLQREQQLQQAKLTEMNRLGEFKFGSISIGINQPLAATWLPQLLPDFYQVYPQIHTDLREVTTSKAEGMLLDGQLDVFIGKTIYHPQLESNPLGVMPLSLLVPQNSRLYRAGMFQRTATIQTISQLNGENFIAIGNESRFQEVVNHHFHDSGIHVNSRIEASDSRVAIQLALKQLGCVIVSQNMVASLDQKLPINIFNFDESLLSLDFSVAYRLAEMPSQTTARFVELCVEKAQRLINTVPM